MKLFPQESAAGERVQLAQPLAVVGARMIGYANAVARLALRDGRDLVTLDKNRLIKKSRQLTGLSDFGDPPVDAPLAMLLRSLEEDAGLNLVGRLTAQSESLRLLCNRLLMQRDRSLNPAIGTESIARPLFITGLPRSGTSYLHALLAQDPASRVPQVWEVMHPSPPPESSSYGSDPRIGRTRRELAWIDILMPGFEKCHPIGACLPQECIAITDHSFLSYLFESMYYVTSYRAWHDLQEKRPAYECHRRFLQHLQWRCPGDHWVLKAPSHLMALDALFQVYPDAQVVVAHRDPLKVLPSCASFAKLLRAPFTGPIDARELGAEVSRRWAGSAASLTRFRAQRKELEGQFLDVSYHELVRDPITVISQVYRKFGRELTAKARSAMEQYVARHPKDRWGEHRYSLEEFGLDLAAERDKFRDYIEYFRVAGE